MSLSKPPQDTGIVLEAQLSHLLSENMFQLTVLSDKDKYEPCLLHNQCNFCHEEDDSCPKLIASYGANVTEVQEVNKHGARIDYECSLAKEFKDPDNPGQTTSTISMTCGWDDEWSPRGEITDCVCKYIIL